MDEQGFVNPEELTQIVSESHFVQVNSLILRFKDTDGTWARVLEGKIPVHINKSDGSLIVEVQVSKPLVKFVFQFFSTYNSLL